MTATNRFEMDSQRFLHHQTLQLDDVFLRVLGSNLPGNGLLYSLCVFK